jgi:hypothetical protein
VTHGFLYADHQWRTVDVLGAFQTHARGITPNGDIVGYYIGSDGVTRGFLLSRE